MGPTLFTVVSLYFLPLNISPPFQNELNSQHVMKVNRIVDPSCAKYQFNKKNDKDWLLAVEIYSDIYFFEVTTIDDHGDAHARDAFCNVVRKAHIEGAIENDKFYPENFRVLNYKEKKDLSKSRFFEKKIMEYVIIIKYLITLAIIEKRTC